MLHDKEFPPPAPARPLYSPRQFLKCFQIVKHALGVVLVSFALPILLGGSPATAQTTPSDTSQSDTIADLQARLAQAREERQQAQTAFEEARDESDEADADYVVANEAYDQAQAAFQALKNDPDRDRVAFRQARETRNTARETMLAAREARNVARTVLVAAREARNVASAQVQDLRAELDAAQEAPVLALESQILELETERDALTEQMNDLTAQAAAASAAAAKDLLAAEQRATAAEQQATDAGQQIIVAEQETAEAEEQVANLELNLHEAHGGCRLENITKDGETVYRTETDQFKCIPNELIYLDNCYSPYRPFVPAYHYSLEIKSAKYTLYSPISVEEGKDVGVDFRDGEGADITHLEIRPSSQPMEVHYRNGGNLAVDPDGTIASDSDSNPLRYDEYIDDILALKDRILAIVSGELTENPLPICE